MSTDIGRCSPMPATLSQVMKLGRRTRADWPRVSGLLVMALILGSAGPAPSATSIPSPSNALWAELDIVPMPKRLRLTGKETVLDGTGGTALVVGTKPCRQTEIGVDWINRKLAERASSPLPVLKEGRTAPNGLSIVIGTRGDNELIDRAAATGLLDIGPGNPGKRGYEIRIARDGTLIYLAGADPVGALYACVTFAELIVKKRGAVVWRQAEVRDWPDFLHVPLGGMTGNTQAPEIGEFLYALKDVAPTPALRERYLKAYRAHFDRLLRWKISYLNYSGMSKYFRDSPPAASLALIREGIQYGKERGIGALVYGGKPFVGQAKDHPDVPIRCLALKKGWIRCWSMDDVRRQTAARFAGFVKAAGFTDVGFHDTDTGGYTNPARWNARCEVCRKRWGDDFVGATVHKHRIYYDALKAAVPDIRVHFTLYPYVIYVLDQATGEDYVGKRYGVSGPALTEMTSEFKARYETFWTRMHAEMPPDVTFCIREVTPEAVKAYRKLTPDRGLFTWYAVLARGWLSFFNESPRWIGTYFDNQNDFMFTQPFAENFVPLQGLAVREYAWNVKAPGAAPWGWLGGLDQWRHCEANGEIYALVLPHIVRNLFGAEAAPEITTAVSQNVVPRHIFDRVSTQKFVAVKWLKDYTDMQQQADRAETGARALDAVWEKCRASGTRLGMSDYAFRRLVYLREVFHSCMWLARARARNLLARELATNGREQAAEAAIEEGLKLVADARVDLKALIAERPDDPILNRTDSRRYKWGEFMACGTDMKLAEDRLVQTRGEIESLCALGGVPKTVVEGLTRGRTVAAVRSGDNLTIDGRLDETVWAGARPVESFFVYQRFSEDARIARAHTRVQTLYDNANLYFGYTCWVPGGQPVRERDMVELFVKSPAGDYAHFFISADGSARHQLSKQGKRDDNWTCESLVTEVYRQPDKWSVEIKFPMAALAQPGATAGWSVNFCRISKLGGEQEQSSTLPPATRFHDTAQFVPITWSGDRYSQPDIALEITDFALKTKTLPDCIASVATFGLELSSDRVLHNVDIMATVYDRMGRRHRYQNVAHADQAYYSWRPERPCEAAYEEIVTGGGGIKLELVSDEGSSERWIRFGGWEGTTALGTVYSAAEPAQDQARFCATRSLKEPCFFSPTVRLDNGRSAHVFSAEAGTVEFWVKPDASAAAQGRNQCFVHFGPQRREHPTQLNNSPFAVYRLAPEGHLGFAVRTTGFRGGWSSSCRTPRDVSLTPGSWHHVSCVWERNAQRDQWLRFYIDGKQVAGLSGVSHEERLGDDPAVRMQLSPFSVQLGALNSGRYCGAGLIDEFRISRVARYTDDFTPATTEFDVDRHTSLLFHFNENLAGSGVTTNGETYQVQATAGVTGF